MKNYPFLVGLSVMLIPATLCAQGSDSIRQDYLTQFPTYNLSDALQSRIPGLDIDAYGTHIRGFRSIFGDEDSPLVVVNGVTYLGRLSDIDPTEVVRIEVLKDASTTARYGYQGKNGVISITTRQTPSSTGTRVSYRGYVTWQQAFAQYPMMNAQQLQQLRQEYDYPAIFPNPFDAYYNDQLIPGEVEGLDINRQDIYGTAIEQNHQVTVSQDWDKGHLMAGAGYTKDEGILPKAYDARYNYFISLSHQWGQYLFLNLYHRYDKQKHYANGGDFEKYLFLPPMVETTSYIDSAMFTGYHAYDKSVSFTQIQLEAKCPWIEGLSYRLNGGFQNNKGKTFPHGAPTSTSAEEEETGTFLRHELSYDWTSPQGQHIHLQGANIDERRAQDNSNFSHTKYTDNQTVSTTGSSLETVFHHHTQLYSLHYDYQGRYELGWNSNWERFYINRNIHHIFSERIEDYHLHPNSDWESSHSLHLQWNLHREPFAQHLPWLDRLSIRADQGLIRDPYFFTVFTQGEEHTNRGISKFRSRNLGLDFSLWKNRLAGSFDLYKQHTNQLPGYTYIYATLSADNTIENQGFELSLQGIIIDHLNDWTWQVGIGLYANHNELTHAEKYLKKQEGHSLNTAHTPIFDGVEEKMGWPHYKGAEYDQYGYFNIVPPEEAYSYIDADPDLRGHFSSQLSWRNWDFSVLGSFQVGGHIYFRPEATFNRLPLNRLDLDYWTPVHQQAQYPNLYDGYDKSYVAYYDATEVRIRAITLGYNLPRIPHISQARIYFTVRNPFVFASDLHDELGIDPAPNSTADKSNQGFRSLFPSIEFKTPSTRDFLLGVNLSF